MKSVALIANFSWVAISTSVINTALYWEAKNYVVDLYVEKPDTQRFPFPNFHDKRITIIETNLNAIWPLSDIVFSYREFLRRGSQYEWVIAFDHNALLRAGFCLNFRRFMLIYHSLEFYEPNMKRVKSRIKKWLERHYAKKCTRIFSQDRFRIEYLSTDLGIEISRFDIIYNSPSGEPIKTKNNYFRSRFNISPESKIVLCVGSLIKEHCIIRLVDSVDLWSHNYVLVMHGWFPDNTVRDYVISKSKLLPGRIYISENLFSEEKRYIPYLSSDIGFLGFESDSENIKLAAGSAGKLFDFLKTGIPIVGYETLGMRALLEDNKVGFVFSDYSKLPSALSRIAGVYDEYRNNCFNAYLNFEFNKQYHRVYNTLPLWHLAKFPLRRP